MEGGPAMDPLFTFKRGATVRMKIHNEAMPEHPFHLHGQFFEIVQPAQPGLKDTVLLPGGSLTEIVAYFDNPGRWMAHCHILEHAALGMMSEIMVEE
jgi:FtsP/CotA-like multicopper oxidase with cupredoxin domain